MIGFAAFIVILVAGILALVGGLRFISGERRETLPPADTTRMDRIESALSALESQLDAVQEQQRFLERLLAERPEPRSLESGAADGADADVDSILFDRDGEGQGGDR